MIKSLRSVDNTEAAEEKLSQITQRLGSAL